MDNLHTPLSTTSTRRTACALIQSTAVILHSLTTDLHHTIHNTTLFQSHLSTLIHNASLIINHHTYKPSSIPFDLTQLCSNLIDLIQLQYISLSIAMECEFPSIGVVGDEQLTRLIIIAVLSILVHARPDRLLVQPTLKPFDLSLQQHRAFTSTWSALHHKSGLDNLADPNYSPTSQAHVVCLVISAESSTTDWHMIQTQIEMQMKMSTKVDIHCSVSENQQGLGVHIGLPISNVFNFDALLSHPDPSPLPQSKPTTSPYTHVSHQPPPTTTTLPVPNESCRLAHFFAYLTSKPILEAGNNTTILGVIASLDPDVPTLRSGMLKRTVYTNVRTPLIADRSKSPSLLKWDLEWGVVPVTHIEPILIVNQHLNDDISKDFNSASMDESRISTIVHCPLILLETMPISESVIILRNIVHTRLYYRTYLSRELSVPTIPYRSLNWTWNPIGLLVVTESVDSVNQLTRLLNDEPCFKEHAKHSGTIVQIVSVSYQSLVPPAKLLMYLMDLSTMVRSWQVEVKDFDYLHELLVKPYLKKPKLQPTHKQSGRNLSQRSHHHLPVNQQAGSLASSPPSTPSSPLSVTSSQSPDTKSVNNPKPSPLSAMTPETHLRLISPAHHQTDTTSSPISVGTPTSLSSSTTKSGPSEDILKPVIPAQMRVLIVEDNPINLQILSAFMVKHKIQWNSATNGERAVQMFASAVPGSGNEYHLVLMDLRLPVIDGLNATKLIRQTEASWMENLPGFSFIHVNHGLNGSYNECVKKGGGLLLGMHLRRSSNPMHESSKKLDTNPMPDQSTEENTSKYIPIKLVSSTNTGLVSASAPKPIRHRSSSVDSKRLMATTSTTSTTTNTNNTGSNQVLMNVTPMFRSIIIALTASNSLTDRKNALAAGCNDFISKPINLQWLLTTIIEWGSIQALIRGLNDSSVVAGS